jgi:hypothetical protein
MRKGLRLASILVVLGIVFGSALTGSAQQRRPPVAGGYKKVSNDAPEVMLAAKFAVSEQAQKQGTTINLISIERAESQVVAGINYRLCLKVAIKNGTQDADVIREIKAVVFRNLKKQHMLKSWKEEACNENG